MDKITLPSGARLEITPLPYLKAWGVSQVLGRVFEKLNIDVKSIQIPEILDTDSNAVKGEKMLSAIMGVKTPLMAVLSSDEIMEAARTCFARCTYNGLKIDDDTFEKLEARADFLPVVFYALYANVSPFFSKLLSFFLKR